MNTQLIRGQIVRAAAGRDKGELQVVLCAAPPYVTLCDGKGRPLERPKQKKAIHVSPTKTILGEERLLTNKQIRKALREFAGAVETEVV